MSNNSNTVPHLTSRTRERMIAARNRAQFDAWGATCLNLTSRSGTGKTQLLEKTIAAFNDKLEIAAISGERTGTFETDVWQDFGIPTSSISTANSGHLNAQTVSEALFQLERQYLPSELDLILIENQENHEFSTDFSVGEHHTIALSSIADCVSQPIASSPIFREADCIVLTQIDRAADLKIDLDRLILNARQINPKATILPLSTATGEGLATWLNWVSLQVALRSQSAKAAKIEYSRSNIPLRSVR
ncbi:MAG: hydrogenase accessory protein HypB [Cyanobacteria bacterium J055]|nr:MAG: hydrogenase accessory protein HypB [Cyanobacteria bacterium J055]